MNKSITQLYSHLTRGWLAICCAGMGLIALCVPFSLVWTGDRPLLGRLRNKDKEPETE